MAKYASQCKETTQTTGTGTLTLDGAAAGYRSFLSPANVNDGDYIEYFLKDADGINWERGFGLLTDAASDTLTRAFILESTNGDAAITLSAGTHEIYMAATPSLPLLDKIYTEYEVTVSQQSSGLNRFISGGTSRHDYFGEGLNGNSYIAVPPWIDVFQYEFSCEMSVPATASGAANCWINTENVHNNTYKSRAMSVPFSDNNDSHVAMNSGILHRLSSAGPNVYPSVRNRTNQTISWSWCYIRMDFLG